MAAYTLVPVTVASALTCGTVLTLLGSVRKHLAQRLDIGEGRVQLLLAALNLTLIPLLPLAGVLINQVGVEHTLIAGSLLAAVGTSLLALRATFTTAASAVMLLGAAGALLLTAATVLMPFAFFSSKTAAVNLGYVFVGLGAVLTPVLTEALLSGLRWRRTLLLVALLGLVPALLAALTPADQFPAYQHGDPEDIFPVPLLWLAGLACLLYVPLETAVGAWAAAKLPELGYRPRAAASLLAGFWIAFLAGRLVMALIFDAAPKTAGKEGWFLFGLCLCLGVVLGNLAGSAHREGRAWALLLAGLFCGPIYPTVVGAVVGRFANEPATAVGTICALGALGNLVATPLVNLDIQQSRTYRALRVPLIAALLLAAVALVMGLNK